MNLSDLSVRRPVICTVAALLLVIVGLLRFHELPVREYPQVDRPVVAVQTRYTGASAEVVESKITEPLEKEVSAIEGIHLIRSSSDDEASTISLEFDIDRDIDQAANDVRDRVGRVTLPDGIDPPRITKSDPDQSPVMTLSFNSETHSRLELTELVERFVVPRIQTVPGVGSVHVDGPRFAMRLWVDSDRLAAYGLTVADVEAALRQQNVDVPGGRIESADREFPVRLNGSLREPADFERMVLVTRNAMPVTFADIGRVELGAEDYRSDTWFKGRPSVGVRVLRQSQANLLDLIAGVKALIPAFREDLPAGIRVEISKDDSVYVQRSVDAVYQTLYEATALVILMIFLFLRSWRATLVPLLAIPVSIIGSVSVLAALDFSINVLTLLACVLAIGLVVDDAIVMLENIYRRIEAGEAPLHASIHGAREVVFPIIATTLTLVAVFVPVAFQSGQIGSLFYEFGITLAVSVVVSALVALTLTPMLSARILRAPGAQGHGWLYERTEPFFVLLNRGFERVLRAAFVWQRTVLIGCALFVALGAAAYTQLSRELVPTEDRGILTATIIGPVGATPAYVAHYSQMVEQIMLAVPEVDRTFHRDDADRNYVSATLVPWERRSRSTQTIMAELRRTFRERITGVQVTVATARPFGGVGGRQGANAVQLVLQGGSFDALQGAGRKILTQLRGDPRFGTARLDPSPSKPQLDVQVDRALAADLAVPVGDVASALETLFGSRRVTRFQRGNQQYDVILQIDDAHRVTPADLSRIHVRSARGPLVQLANLVQWHEALVPESYPHFNRLRAVTLSAQLADGTTIGDAVAVLGAAARSALPDGYAYSWDGQAREYVEGSSDTVLLFALALLFTFLILAAQFESWIHPLTIFAGIVLALAGGVAVLYCSRWWGPPMTDNLFARFGLIMLIGLVAKNGILIVEFANQLQIEHGRNASQAAFEAASLRFRPVLMTSVSTILGALPIALSGGAGAETRNPLGLVVVGGLTLSTALTLLVVPILYVLMDRLSVALTGNGSAAGLIRARDIARHIEALPQAAAPPN